MTKYIEAISIYDSIKDIIDKAFESLYFAIVIDKTGNIIYMLWGWIRKENIARLNV